MSVDLVRDLEHLFEKYYKGDNRPSWDEYFTLMTVLISQRSTCTRRKVGAVLVRDNMVLTSGYNGVPRTVKHCSEAGCIRDQMNVPSGQRHELCRGLHAEQNAIIQAAHHGIDLKGSTLFCTTKPCIICTKMIINAGISRVRYITDYDDTLVDSMAEEAGLKLEKISL